MLRDEIRSLVEKAIKELYKTRAEVKIDKPENDALGDYATNAALLLAKELKQNPLEIAEEIKQKIQNKKYKILDTVAVASPGFINFFIVKEYLQSQVGAVLKEKEKFGQLKIGRGKKVNVEFISANPTGPLTLGNGRGGFCGDVFVNILNKAGYKATREYYLNDRGEQVTKLGRSVLADEQAVYKGDYVLELGKRVSEKSSVEAGEKAAKIIFDEMIKPAIKRMGINFDVWFSEKSLYEESEVKKTLDFLKKKDFVYEKEGAVWFKSSQFGDDKDRVLVKADGEETYFLSDIAYLKDKFKRGFENLVFFWGADHYGYIGRIKAAAQALGQDPEKIEIIIMQLVRLFENGQEVRMSKRAGIYVTLDELLDEVSLDVARFFFLTRGYGSHLNFDLNLAKEQSENNPVYYIQYAHARICSILAKYGKFRPISNFQTLKHESELNLIKQLIRFPEIVEDTAKDYQVHRLPQYALDLAASFHRFYRDCQVIGEDKKNVQSRLALILAAKIVLKNVLDLMGISAPEKM